MLRYYVSETEIRSKGAIPLKDILDVTDPAGQGLYSDFTFLLNPLEEGGRTYQLKADNLADKAEWIVAISSQVRRRMKLTRVQSNL